MESLTSQDPVRKKQASVELERGRCPYFVVSVSDRDALNLFLQIHTENPSDYVSHRLIAFL